MILNKSNIKRHQRVEVNKYVQIFNPKTRNWVKFCNNSDKTILDSNKIDTINFKTPINCSIKKKW